MKAVVQAFIISIIIHMIYFVVTVVIGLSNTLNYKPNIDKSWSNTVNLPNFIAFGSMQNYFNIAISFIVVILVSFITIKIIEHFKRMGKPE